MASVEKAHNNFEHETLMPLGPLLRPRIARDERKSMIGHLQE
jgi:hypothetical protein